MPALSRRSLLQASAAALAVSRVAEGRGLLLESLLQDVCASALEAAKRSGATYADVRIHRRRNETVSVRDDHVEGVGDDESYGVGVRVLVDGAWGFCSTSRVQVSQAQAAAKAACELARANARVLQSKVELAPEPAHVDVWQTPLEKDPFKIPIADKAELLLEVSRALLAVPGVSYATASLESRLEWKLFANSDGSLIEQSITRLGPGYEATAVDEKSSDFQTRAWDGAGRQAGYEWLEQSRFLDDARQVGEEAVQKLKSPGISALGNKHLILSPTNLWLTIHESVGHPTELDRALGYEANLAGTSFATPDKLGKLKYGSEQVTLYADKTTPGGLATVGYDDDGVRTQRWNLVERGLFVGYQTTREQAGWISEKASRGCSYAQDHKSVPFQRMPNVSLQPGPKDLGVKDLIAATDDGVYIVGNGSWSIDHQRYNFQFGGQMFFEVKKGKVTRALKDVAYQSNSLEFWSSLDLLGGPAEWKLGAAFDDGKGEPMQSNPVSHGCPPARFKANLINTRSKKEA
ncbi:MAG: TldD/PmbA family protein [Archangiaceae bacterium]|nr:TldD/PmbA family protein [Archangiaceae bacterium]